MLLPTRGGILFYMPMRYAFLVFFVLVTALCYAQRDSAYVQPYEREFSIKPRVYYKFTMLTCKAGGGEKVTYVPNSPVRIGLGVTYKNFSISGGYGFGFMRDKKRGDTKELDFQYHYYGRKFIADIFFQQYKGFYTEDKGDISIYPDIKAIQYGMSGQYVFNNKRFSYKAAFNQSERQLKSAGSWQLGGGLYYNEIRSDSTLRLNKYNRVRGYQLNVSGGYIYNWVISKHFYLSGGAAFGVNLGIENTTGYKKVEVSPSVFPRISAGYNADDWSIVVSGVINQLYVTNSKSLKMLFHTGEMQINYIKRFEFAPKFLRRVKFINK